MYKDILARIGVVVAIVIAIIGCFLPILPEGGTVAGAITTGTNFKFGISVGNPTVIGANPTNFKKILGGTCSLIANSFTVGASTTVPMDCAITGVLSTDKVFAQFATSSVVGNGWEVQASSASSTAGFITLRVSNFSGASNVIPASIASTTQYFLFGTQ